MEPASERWRPDAEPAPSTLLLVDDEPRVLDALQLLLADDGYQILARVKEMHSKTLRIVLSGSADDAAYIGSINRGEVYRYYTKPWDAAELRSNLREAFRHYWHLQEAGTGRSPTDALNFG